jgi:putative peptide zinc metalloprotease protein
MSAIPLAPQTPTGPLPTLRPDLEFRPGPVEYDGEPTWTVYDPASGQYAKLGWAEAQVLRRLRPGTRLEDLEQELRTETPLRLSREEILAFCQDAKRHNLLAGSPPASETLLKQVENRRMHPLKWLLRNYLYFRIPLLHPEAILRKGYPWVAPLASSAAVAVYLASTFLGLFLLTGRWEQFVNTFPRFLSWEGALAYALTLTGVKVVHEFAHAFTAHAHGIRVRSMGIAFIVLWPVPYSDVTDAWRLAGRSRRFLIGAAGILAELALASIALLVWCLAPGETLIRSVAFLLCTATLLSTLAVNLNPAMRFDGYYLLADAWNVDNLRPRATALARWTLRRWCLGMELPCPEPDLAQRPRWPLMAYAIYAWVYRFFLYLAIAAIVYTKFTKAIGIILFAAEIWWFIVMPAVKEVKALAGLRKYLTPNPRSILTGLVLAGVALWLALPLQRPLRIPAIAANPDRQVLYAPEEGELREVATGFLQPVEAGQPLYAIHAPELTAEEAILRHELAALAAELDAIPEELQTAGLRAQKLEEIEKAKAQLARIREALARTRVTARLDGIVQRWNESLRDGSFVGEGDRLGEVVAPRSDRVVAFVAQLYVGDLRPGDAVRFAPAGTARYLHGTVQTVTAIPGRDVSAFSVLANPKVGELPTRRGQEGRLELTEPRYRVDVRLAGDGGLAPERTGTLYAQTRPRSRIADLVRYVRMVFIRESSF